MLQQGFRRSSAQNRGLGGDVRLKSGESAAVPTAATAAVGVQKTTEKSAAEPRYMTFEAQIFLLNKDTRLCTLTFGRCGDEAPGGLTPQIVDTKIVF